MRTLHLCIPSRGRLESLRRCVNSALAYASGTLDLKVFVFFDDDESCCRAYIPPKNVSKIITSPRQYYVKTINNAKDWVEKEGGELFVIVNNDNEFLVPDWDSRLLECLVEKSPTLDCVLDFGEGSSYNAFISTTTFWDKHFQGKVFDEMFVQYFSDTHRLKQLKDLKLFHRIIPVKKTLPGMVLAHTSHDEVGFEGNELFEQDQLTYHFRVEKLPNVIEVED